MAKNNAIIYGEIIAKCWESDDFRQKFVADPESVLSDAGFQLEEGVTYKVIEAPKFVQYLVIPAENPKEAVQKISAELLNRVEQSTVVVPEGVEVRIIQNTDDVRNLILPASPKNLSADELKAISGGNGAPVIQSTSIQTSTEITAVNTIVLDAPVNTEVTFVLVAQGVLTVI